MSEVQIKQQVREFYDQVGWQVVGEDLYQNARYEDLRPVSREYIHLCHMRVKRFLKSSGRYLLDAGSGPVQYPEYLTYSEDYVYRVCLDISIVALREARKRFFDLNLSKHGLFVVADVANLPFKAGVFEGIVSLHTLHHLPLAEQEKAYLDLHRVLVTGCSAVVVNGWTETPLMRIAQPFIITAEWLISKSESVRKRWKRLLGKSEREPVQPLKEGSDKVVTTFSSSPVSTPTRTFIQKRDAPGLREMLKGRFKYEIYVWRSVSVRFLRALIHDPLAGRYWLRQLYRLEERFPHWFGEKGQYPLLVLCKHSTALDQQLSIED